MTTHPLDQIVGPFHDVAGASARLGCSEQAVRDEISARTIVACHLSNGQPVMPTWQFYDDPSRVHPDVATVWALLAESSDDWTAALWMCGQQDVLDGTTAAEWLTAGRPPAPVRDAALKDIRRWAEGEGRGSGQTAGDWIGGDGSEAPRILVAEPVPEKLGHTEQENTTEERS